MFDEKKYKDFYKYLKIPGLKPSDYFLFKSIRDYFLPYTPSISNTRQVFVLGIRLIYTCFYDPVLREKIFTLAERLQHEDLDRQLEHIEYKSLQDIIHQESQERRG